MDGMNTNLVIDELQKLIDGIKSGEFFIKNITMARGTKITNEGEYVSHATTNERTLTVYYLDESHD